MADESQKEFEEWLRGCKRVTPQPPPVLSPVRAVAILKKYIDAWNELYAARESAMRLVFNYYRGEC